MLYLVFSQQLLAFWAPTVYQNWTEYTEQDLDLPVWKPESTAIMGKALWTKPLGLSGKLTPAVEFECSQEVRGEDRNHRWSESVQHQLMKQVQPMSTGVWWSYTSGGFWSLASLGDGASLVQMASAKSLVLIYYKVFQHLRHCNSCPLRDMNFRRHLSLWLLLLKTDRSKNSGKQGRYFVSRNSSLKWQYL